MATNLSHQYIAAVLNQANGACCAGGYSVSADDATDFFANNGTSGRDRYAEFVRLQKPGRQP
jgi:hypothetical protein